MSALDLRIEVDRNQREFFAGEEIAGEVVVLANKKTKCNGLELSLEWATHGHGNVTEEVVDSMLLFDGEFESGEEVRYPFRFTLPSGPYTYHGHYLNVDWCLHLEADVPWAFDPKTDYDFKLEPGDNPEISSDSPSTLLDSQVAELGELATVVKSYAGGLMVFIGLLCIGYVALEGNWSAMPPGLFIGVPLLLFGAFMGFSGVRKALAERKLGEVKVEFNSTKLHPGEEFEATLRFQPQSEAQLLDVTAEVTGMERVVSGSGTSQTTYTHELHTSITHVHKDELRTFRPGMMAELKLHGQIPDDAPYSFSAPSNALNWSVTIHIDIARCPDWKESFPVLVLPNGSQNA